jgi:hypothetical protein
VYSREILLPQELCLQDLGRILAVRLWAGNWKMNPTSKAEAVNLARGIAAAVTNNSPCDVGIFVPFPYIETVQNIVGDKLVVGAEVGNILRFVTKCSSSAFIIQCI